jgi:hypothetical protein
MNPLPAPPGPEAEALCLTDDADWEAIAKKLGGRLVNRALGDTGEYETLLVVPALPDTPPIVCLCGSTRFIGEFNRHRKELTEHGEIVLSIEVVTTQARENDPQHADPALKARLDELHKRKIDLADYCLVVSGEDGYFGQSTTGEIAYAVAHGKPVRFAEAAARERAHAAGLIS